MIRRVLLEPGWDAFRSAARALLAEGVPPEDVEWTSEREGLFAVERLAEMHPPAREVRVSLSRPMLDLLRHVAHHRASDRGPLLYRALWRWRQGERHLLDLADDPDVLALRAMDAAVRRCAHKAQAFVRFRQVTEGETSRYVAWYDPEHPILPLVADFFTDRFRTMCWSILTPDASLHFDGTSTTQGPGLPRAAAPRGDELEDLWRSYYRAIFNPARVMVSAMCREMPRRHWSTLPETQAIPSLVAEAAGRVASMQGTAAAEVTASRWIPPRASLPMLMEALPPCRACACIDPSLHAVPGEGSTTASIVLVGEQPGDEEDRAGRPFVGPAGAVLDRALALAGIERSTVWLTNAVKHFNYVPQGKKRLHARPRDSQLRACRPWLLAELERIRPKTIVALGTTASRALLGALSRVERDRGRPHPSPWAEATWVTFHPSAVLRARSAQERDERFAALVEDLRRAAAFVPVDAVGIAAPRSAS